MASSIISRALSSAEPIFFSTVLFLIVTATKAEIKATTTAIPTHKSVQVVSLTGAPPYLVFIVHHNISILLY